MPEALRWFVVFNGTADRYLWGFEADGWLFDFSPPGVLLGILRAEGGDRVATIEDARWFADVLAFDHDAPVGISPAVELVGSGPLVTPKDPNALPLSEPVVPYDGAFADWYWNSVNEGLFAVAELRFNGSYVLRYDEANASRLTAFSSRFKDKEELVGLYAMAARQTDPLSEYLCLYRILEGADKGNGKEFVADSLSKLADHDFGDLFVFEVSIDERPPVNAFETYRHRAQQEIGRLGDSEVPRHLYGIRNAIAHGKTDVATHVNAERLRDASAALPLVKLLARLAVEF